MGMHAQQPQQQPSVRQRRRVFTWKRTAAGAGVAVAFIIGLAAGSGGSHQVVRTVAGPVRTVTRTVNVPTGKVVYKPKAVPGPTVYKVKTVYVPATQGPAGTVIARYSGSGNQATGQFTVPASGDYVAKWTYSGNTDPSLGGATNFIVSNTGDGLGDGLPNDIQSSGSGSTEVTSATGTDGFSVQATGTWAITVMSAP